MAPDFQEDYFKIFVWTLVDSDNAKDGIPPYLLQNPTPLFVIYASSPNSERWKHIDKNADEVTIIMNPWTLKEILRV